jgi:lipopolysaccharide transport system permease protein
MSKFHKMSKSSKTSMRVVYTPESLIRHPLILLKEMGRDLLASRELAWRLLVRDISAQYRQSLLGILWAFFPPIIAALGLVMAKNAGAVNIGVTDIPYPAYVMFSMSLWQTFVEALMGPLAAVGAAKPMLAKINFPKESIILAKLGEIFFNFGIKLILIIGLFVWFKIPVTWSAVLSFVAVIHLIILGTAIGLVIAPFGALYGDIGRIIPLIVTPWLLLTPVIYPIPKQGWFSTVVNWNPVTPLLVTARDLATSGVVADPTGFWVVSGLSFGLLFMAWILYRLSMPFIVERMSS